MKVQEKFNRTVQSQGNLQTMATLSQTPQQVNFTDSDDLMSMKLNQVRRINKQQESNLSIMKCRLNHIQNQDQQGQRNISRTKHEINRIISTKSRVKLDQERKQWLEDQKQRLQEQINKKVYLSKEERQRRLQRIELQKQIYSGTYSQMHKDYKQEINSAKNLTYSEIFQENTKSHNIIRKGHLQHMYDKQMKLEEKQQIGYMNYQQQLQYESNLYKWRQNQMNDLETNELQYLNHLRVTQNQDRALSAKRDEIKNLPIDTFSPKRNLFRITSSQTNN